MCQCENCGCSPCDCHRHVAQDLVLYEVFGWAEFEAIDPKVESLIGVILQERVSFPKTMKHATLEDVAAFMKQR